MGSAEERNSATPVATEIPAAFATSVPAASGTTQAMAVTSHPTRAIAPIEARAAASPIAGGREAHHCGRVWRQRFGQGLAQLFQAQRLLALSFTQAELPVVYVAATGSPPPE